MYMEKNPLFAALTDQYHHQSADGGGGGEGLDCGNSNSINNSKSMTDTCPDCHGAGYLADNQPCLMCPGPSISSMPLPSRSRIYTLMQSRDHYQLDSSSSFMAPSSLAATPRSSSRSSSRHHHHHHHRPFFDIDSDHDGDVEDHDDGDVSDTACPGHPLQATSTASTARGRSRVSRKHGGIVEA
ncbi:hypothetical protein BC829DRAFT_379495 [Chytridium lagenaria]|nr:hypothetical protein BC829DRAFT_379495 [Chytridium lagenaria]